MKRSRAAERVEVWRAQTAQEETWPATPSPPRESAAEPRAELEHRRFSVFPRAVDQGEENLLALVDSLERPAEGTWD